MCAVTTCVADSVATDVMYDVTTICEPLCVSVVSLAERVVVLHETGTTVVVGTAAVVVV